jgi:hypothetical protein
VSENPLERLQAAGVSIWLDTLSRERRGGQRVSEAAASGFSRSLRQSPVLPALTCDSTAVTTLPIMATSKPGSVVPSRRQFVDLRRIHRSDPQVVLGELPDLLEQLPHHSYSIVLGPDRIHRLPQRRVRSMAADDGHAVFIFW